MAKLVCLVVAVAMLGVASCHGVELQEGAAYRIQSVFDGGVSLALILILSP